MLSYLTLVKEKKKKKHVTQNQISHFYMKLVEIDGSF